MYCQAKEIYADLFSRILGIFFFRPFSRFSSKKEVNL